MTPQRQSPPRLRDHIAGRHLLVTGVTGFIGQALLSRLLTDLPDARISVLIRPSGGTGGHERLRALLDQPVFAPLRERGDDLDAVAARVQVVEGGLGATCPALPGDLDVVLHCAATVSFDPPIDEGFTTNLQGATSLYTAVRDSGSRAHLVHVSTAYVAGVRKGVVAEGPLEHSVDWRMELDSALAARMDVERASRRPEVLDRFMAAARSEHGRAGPQAIAKGAEERRRAWVDRRLVEHGRARAQSLGWPDVYTLTKALSERAAAELAAGGAVDGTTGHDPLPLSIVRPSIVESALRWPFPGWIEGFKMAEPLILAYGRGELPEFPAVPDGIVDLIPVDLVVNALVAVATTAPEPARPAYYHVSSGDRNPLAFKDLYEHVRGYFQADPLPEAERGEAIAVPEWRFPGRTRVEKMLRTGERLVDTADRVLDRLPRSDRTRDLLTKAHRARRKVEFVRRYADLYAAYTEAEVIYTDEAAHALHRSLQPEDREELGFDSAVIDWRHYLQDVHCPSVTQVLRAGRRTRSEAPLVLDRSATTAAVFDLEGTIISSNVVESYLWLRLAELPPSAWASEIADVARRLPRYLAADRRDRGEFLRTFYRRYEGADAEGVERLVAEQIADLVLTRASPAALRRIRRHRAAGHRTILITGAIEAVVQPLAPLFDEIQATRLAVDDGGRYSGYLDEPPLVGEARAAWLRRHAAREGIDLAASYAYGDSHSDLPLLAAVGHPVAVNPDAGLYRTARRRRWPVERWRHDAGSSRLTLPEPVPAAGTSR